MCGFLYENPGTKPTRLDLSFSNAAQFWSLDFTSESPRDYACAVLGVSFQLPFTARNLRVGGFLQWGLEHYSVCQGAELQVTQTLIYYIVLKSNYQCCGPYLGLNDENNLFPEYHLSQGKISNYN